MAVNPTTPAGLKLKTLLGEYRDMMSVDSHDKRELKNRAMKLYQIVSAACPKTPVSLEVARDLTNVVFNTLVEDWGKVYNESSIFRLDYSISGGPAAIDMVNGYMIAMVELVEGAKNNSRITFNVERLGEVVKNTNVLQAIATLKTNIERRQASMG